MMANYTHFRLFALITVLIGIVAFIFRSVFIPYFPDTYSRISSSVQFFLHSRPISICPHDDIESRNIYKQLLQHDWPRCWTCEDTGLRSSWGQDNDHEASYTPDSFRKKHLDDHHSDILMINNYLENFVKTSSLMKIIKAVKKQSDNNHGIQLKKTGQFWTKPSDFETVHLDSLMDTLNVSRTGFPMEDLFFQYNWFLNSSGSFDLVYEHLVGSKSQPLIPRFVRDAPGVELAPYHYLLVEHLNMTHFELPTSPPGSTLALASALQATFEQRQRTRFQRLERSMARQAAAASASGASPGSGDIGGPGGPAGSPALPESAADADADEDGDDAVPQEVKAVLASDTSDVWCSARHPLTLYVQLQGCRYLQLEPLTSCRTPGIGRASDAPCQTTQIFVSPRSLVFYDSSYYHVWSYPVCGAQLPPPCNEFNITVAYMRTFRYAPTALV